MAEHPQFLALWPTVLMHDRLPADDAINAALVEEIMRLDTERPDLTTGYLADNLLASDHPALSWLRDCINHAVVRYIEHSRIDYKVDWHLQGWANINRFGALYRTQQDRLQGRLASAGLGQHQPLW